MQGVMVLLTSDSRENKSPFNVANKCFIGLLFYRELIQSFDSLPVMPRGLSQERY